MNRKTADKEERDAAKAYLQKYYMAKMKRRILERRHDELVQELKAPTKGSRYNTMPRNKTAPDGGHAVSVVCRLDEVEQRIEDQRQAMSRTMVEVMDMVDLLPQESHERTVVELRHIDCLAWEQIGRTIHMSRSRVNDYYRKALEMIMANDRAKGLVVKHQEDLRTKSRF